MLLALHYAAVALRLDHLTSARLCSRSLSRAATHKDLPGWIPTQETFLSWLLHHKIAVRLSRDLWAAGSSAEEFAGVGPRLRIYRLGKLILEREGATVPPKVGGKPRYKPSREARRNHAPRLR